MIKTHTTQCSRLQVGSGVEVLTTSNVLNPVLLYIHVITTMYILNKPCGLVHRGMIGSGIESELQHCDEDLQLMGRGCPQINNMYTHIYIHASFA